MVEFWLIRHAESEVNLMNREFVAGRSSWAELTPHGIAQASALKLYVKKNNIQFSKVICSPTIRAQQTARFGIPQSVDYISPLITEINLGSWEGQFRHEVYTKNILKQLKKDSWNFLPPHGESQKDVFERTLSLLQQEISSSKKNDRVAVITHGYVIKFLLSGLNFVPKNTAFTIPIGNTSITVVEFSQASFKEKVRNNLLHLQELGLHYRGGVYEV